VLQATHKFRYRFNQKTEDAMTNVASTFPKPADIDDGRNDATTKYEALSQDVAVVDAAARKQELELETSHPSGVLGELARGELLALRQHLVGDFKRLSKMLSAQGIVPRPVKVVTILVATGDGNGAGRDEREHRVPDPRLVAVIGHRLSDPLAHAELALGLTQQQPGV
jgi:hypothetical protein